jgi:orotidine-5'-phosphate decarboxylase
VTYSELFQSIILKKSYLCVGLDTDIKKIPKHLLSEKDPVFEFNRRIIDATYKHAVACKPNIAFYEAGGLKGWESLQKTMDYLPKDLFTIADAKRGDIGNTSSLYARGFFDKASSGFDFDSVTVAPYMGRDSVQPFLEFKNKWVILLALTSNPGSSDFQFLQSGSDHIYEKVLQISNTWGNSENMMYVVGATHPEMFQSIRKIIPEHFILVPGVGAQGGSLEEVSKNGMNKSCGLLVNSSRQIIYSSDGADFHKSAEKEAQKIASEMEIMLNKYLG